MYTLADGSTSDQYKVGDKFVVQEDEGTFKTGSVIKLIENDQTYCPKFQVVTGGTTCYGKDVDDTAFEEWSNLVKYVEEKDAMPTSHTPFQKAGCTKDTVFKVIRNECGGEFPIGSLVQIVEDDGTDFPGFRLADDDADTGYIWYYKFKRELKVVGEKETPKPTGLGTQAGGTHYLEMGLQPVELAYKLQATPCFTKLAKYLTRNKGERKLNLEKAYHVIELEESLITEEMYSMIDWSDMNQVREVEDLLIEFTNDGLVFNALRMMYVRHYDLAKFWVDKIIEEEQNGKLEN